MEHRDKHDSPKDDFMKSTTYVGQNVSLNTNMSSFNSTDSIMLQNYQPKMPSNTIQMLQDIIYVLDNFGVPTILTIGFVSNLVLAITVRNTELKKVSTCCYFFTMGIVDTLYLIAMSIPWVSVRIVDIYNTEGFCQLVYYLNLLTTFLSSWYVVMLLFERALVSYRPDIADKYCSAFRTKCYVTTVSVLSIVSHLYLTWTSGVYIFGTFRLCTVIPENARDIMILRKVDIVFSFIIPIASSLFLIITLILFLLAYKLPCKDGALTVETKRLTFEVRLNTPRGKSYSTDTRQTRDVTSRAKQLELRSFKKSKRLTIVSLVISIVYVAFFIPHNIIKSRITFMDRSYNVTQYDTEFLRLFEELFKINFAYKGLIYFITLPEFRNNLVSLIVSCFKTKRLSKGEKINGATTV